MIHEALHRLLERVGATVTPVEGGTVVHVPGADRRYLFQSPDEDRRVAVYSHHVEDPDKRWFHGVRGQDLSYLATALHRFPEGDYRSPGTALSILRDIGDGHHTTFLPGHAVLQPKPTLADHQREVYANQYVNADGTLSHAVGLRNANFADETFVSNSPHHQPAEPPHENVLSLARELLRTRDDTVGHALADAVSEHHGLPAKYARHYAACVR